LLFEKEITRNISVIGIDLARSRLRSTMAACDSGLYFQKLRGLRFRVKEAQCSARWNQPELIASVAA
jgi:hypothetical protein